jgi:CheY-like chemotaxis protein/HPt (histidine-containing phosphotransfer) domain-containing protein/anti-sigma regulatory factor (Ser/Thr protein kinase)
MLERIQFSVQGVIEDVVELLAVRGAERGVELVHRIDPRIPPKLGGDSGRLRQVVMNLVENAIKFTRNGDVSVRADAVGRAADRVQVRIAVRDTGVGIPADKLEAVFAKFTQADSSTTRRFGGTGLGLTIARHLVQLMGGDIIVESEVGRGSTFSFTVPFEVISGEDVQAPRADLSGSRVLVASAHRLRLDSLVERLQRLTGASPTALEASPHALAEAAAVAVDVAVIDCGRERRVAEIVPQLRKSDALARAHLVLLVTAGQTPVQRYHDVTVVLKPVRDPQLVAALARALGQRPDAVTAAAAAAGAVQVGAGSRILLAEDNLVNQKVATHMLERIGCRVDLASDGTEAVAMLSLLPYDLVLMDCQMPGMDGYAASAAIRQLPGRVSRIPIVALTAAAQKGDAERCFDAGMDDYLSKPVTFKGLADAVTRWVGRERGGAETPVAIDVERLRSVVGAGAPDGVLEDIVQAFLDDTPRAVEEIRRATAARDAGALRGSAHALKGSSTLVGAVALRQVCASIEAASIPEAEGMLPDLETAADRACAKLRSMLGAM